MPKEDKEYLEHIQRRAQEPPCVVYKYVSPSLAEIILKSCMLRFQSPLKYNDPFDCQWDLHWPAYTDEAKSYAENLLRSALLDPDSWPEDAGKEHLGLSVKERNMILSLDEDAQNKHINNFITKYLYSDQDRLKGNKVFKNILEKMRILCVTENPVSVLMWSHYACNHEGFVLGFDSAVLEDYFRRPLEKVRYVRDLPQLFDPKEWYRSIIFGTKRALLDDVVETICLSKHKDWKYEKEWRFTFVDSGPAIGLFAQKYFPKNSLVEIIAGCKTNKKDIVKVSAMAKAVNSKVIIRQLAQHQSKFELSFNSPSK